MKKLLPYSFLIAHLTFFAQNDLSLEENIFTAVDHTSPER